MSRKPDKGSKAAFDGSAARDSGKPTRHSSRFSPATTAATANGQLSPSSRNRPPAAGPRMKPTPKQALNWPKRVARSSGVDRSAIGRRHRDAAAGHAGDGAQNEQHPKRRQKRHGGVVERRPADRGDQDGLPADAVRQAAEQGREQELHQGVERQEEAVGQARRAPAGRRAEQVGQDRQHQADAGGIENDGQEDRQEAGGLGHGKRDRGRSLVRQGGNRTTPLD